MLGCGTWHAEIQHGREPGDLWDAPVESGIEARPRTKLNLPDPVQERDLMPLLVQSPGGSTCNKTVQRDNKLVQNAITLAKERCWCETYRRRTGGIGPVQYLAGIA
jgi:hypothetical protein